LLRDFCGGQRREIYVLVSALRERIAADLLAASDSLPREVLVARLAKKLEDNLGLDKDVARWAVESWGLALGKLTAADLKKTNGKVKAFDDAEDDVPPKKKPSPVRAKKKAAPLPDPAPQPAPEPDPNLLWGTDLDPEPVPAPDPELRPARNYKLLAGIAVTIVLVVGTGISVQQWRAAEEAKRQAQLRAEQLRKEAEFRRQQALLLQQQQQRAQWERQQRERAQWEQQQRQRQWQPRQPTWQEQQRQAQVEQQRRQWEQQRQAQLVEQQRRQQEAEQRRFIEEGAKIIDRLFR
jgi:hypothetical protein